MISILSTKVSFFTIIGISEDGNHVAFGVAHI
jgi:hypothetical protein